jgi:hypothetical protein
VLLAPLVFLSGQSMVNHARLPMPGDEQVPIAPMISFTDVYKDDIAISKEWTQRSIDVLGKSG